MADTISNYRQVRLVLQVPSGDGGRVYWSLNAVRTRKGIPSSVCIADGHFYAPPGDWTIPTIISAVQTVAEVFQPS